MLFVTDSIQLIQQVSYQENCRRVWRFKKGGRVFRTVKYADGLVLLAKEQTMLQHMIDGTETLRCYGMEMNVEKI